MIIIITMNQLCIEAHVTMKRSCIVVAVLCVNCLLFQIHFTFSLIEYVCIKFLISLLKHKITGFFPSQWSGLGISILQNERAWCCFCFCFCCLWRHQTGIRFPRFAEVLWGEDISTKKEAKKRGQILFRTIISRYLTCPGSSLPLSPWIQVV